MTQGSKTGRGRKRAAALPAPLCDAARRHVEAALQTLVEIATSGESEAARVSAANALLDRGYGKAGLASADAERTPRGSGTKIKRVYVDAARPDR